VATESKDDVMSANVGIKNVHGEQMRVYNNLPAEEKKEKKACEAEVEVANNCVLLFQNELFDAIEWWNMPFLPDDEVLG